MFAPAAPMFLTVKHGISCQSVTRVGLLVIIAIAVVYQAYATSQVLVLLQGLRHDRMVHLLQALRNDTDHIIYLMEMAQPMTTSANIGEMAARLSELVLVLTEPLVVTPH
ncbi:putative methyl-accepting chemotaxis protein [Anopheles sinensis]|uniref:Putative methyl-accepting chemotaxis protein n=1 Tax=Anopheles sinensis TaxID=74873 RepID=A0A084VLV2_ANOSI|nr:putative methyl-accepting chemotaxis protein [Anopheles sinensis]